MFWFCLLGQHPQTGSAPHFFYLDLRLSLPLGRTSKVNWGFAGLRHTLSTSPARFRWTHNTIDSQDNGVVDEGEVIQRDGVDIETGIGLNPATGKRETYEEIWRDEPLPPGSPYTFVFSSASVEESTAVMAVLGPHALALAQEAEDPERPRKFHAVRMHRRMNAVRGAQEHIWEIVFSTGNPGQERELKELVGLAYQGNRYAQGNRIYLGCRSWIIWDMGWKETVEVDQISTKS